MKKKPECNDDTWKSVLYTQKPIDWKEIFEEMKKHAYESSGKPAIVPNEIQDMYKKLRKYGSF